MRREDRVERGGQRRLLGRDQHPPAEQRRVLLGGALRHCLRVRGAGRRRVEVDHRLDVGDPQRGPPVVDRESGGRAQRVDEDFGPHQADLFGIHQADDHADARRLPGQLLGGAQHRGRAPAVVGRRLVPAVGMPEQEHVRRRAGRRTPHRDHIVSGRRLPAPHRPHANALADELLLRCDRDDGGDPSSDLEREHQAAADVALQDRGDASRFRDLLDRVLRVVGRGVVPRRARLRERHEPAVARLDVGDGPYCAGDSRRAGRREQLEDAVGAEVRPVRKAH